MKKIVTGIGFEITGVLMILFPFLIASLSHREFRKYNRVGYPVGKILADSL